MKVLLTVQLHESTTTSIQEIAESAENNKKKNGFFLSQNLCLSKQAGYYQKKMNSYTKLEQIYCVKHP